MEYLNKFRSTVSSTVSSVAQQVSQSLPVTLLIKTFNSNFNLQGNPIFREYEVQNVCVASAGPALSWKIYSATKNTTKQVNLDVLVILIQLFRPYQSGFSKRNK